MSYQVNLQFTADTQQAKQQLQSLQQQLTSLVNTPVNIGEKMTAEMQEATHAAAELKIHLQNATNVKTGSLDFGKLSSSIKQSGMSISEYGIKLQSLGPKGQQAFMTLANSVASAEVPLRRSSAALTGMLTSLKNTMKWQMSSSLMHGLISGVQKAYGYAQDLNESLNNIRIVTGQNIDQMSKFAEKANKAAKALSTTTTEYTNASLIYYQQGLDNAQVKERTDATIKMANVSRQSAEVVSDQMTAIWNNFDNGSKSLEYYADVVTALGAATASSSDEIAQGLEKFASVAETVGLSYEYATAALATVTATTRQSADVVGTAFKTLFARLNDLKLGETLDDGTTLGQYTENLAKVGVNIKDASGQLKDMDTILEETAAKWQNLDRDQQTALAKGVAGIRQYNQFIALMDNWDYMQKNLKTVEESGGTLQKQADIYAESWEAARKRVTASSEQMYSALLDDEFFIDITNNFADLIDSVGKFIKSIGGLQGVLSTLGVIATKVFEKQIAQGLRNMAYNLKMSTETGRAMVRDERHIETSKMAESMASSETSGDAQLAAKDVYTNQLQAQSEYIMNAEHMTEFEREKYQILMEQYKAFGQQTIEIARQVELLKERRAKASIDIMGSGMNAGATLESMTTHLQTARKAGEGMGNIEIIFNDINRTGEVTNQTIKNLEENIIKAGGTTDDIEKLDNAFYQLEHNGKDAAISMEQIKAVMQEIQIRTSKDILHQTGIKEGTDEYKRLTAVLRDYMNASSDARVQEHNLSISKDNLKTQFTSLKEAIKASGVELKDWATGLTGITSGMMSLGMAISSIRSLKDTLSNPEISGWERFGAVLTSVSMIMMSMSGIYKGLVSIGTVYKAITDKETLAKIANAAASVIQAKASKKVSQAQDQEEKETRETKEEINKQTAAKVANAAADKIEFKGRNGRPRTFSGKMNKKGKYNEQIISDKLVKKNKLDQFGKTPKGGGEKVAGEAGKKLLNPGTIKTLVKFAGTAAIVAAAVAGASLAISKASEYYNRHQIEADKAAKAAQKLAESYNEVKEAESTFRSNISNYSEAVKGLENLTKGTTEYKEAVMAANEKALELLKTNKDLEYTVDEETGLIEIDEESLDREKQESLKKERYAQAASLSAEQNAKNKQLEADKVKFNRDQAETGVSSWDTDDTTVAAGAGGAAASLAAGAIAIGAINAWNPAGWAALAVGILSAAAAGAVAIGGAMIAFGDEAAESEEKALDAIAARREELGRDLDEKEIKEIALKYDDSGKLGESLAGTVDALNKTNDMAQAINENTAAIRKNSEIILGQEYGSAAAEWLVDTYDEQYNKSKEELNELNKNINKAEDLDEGSEATEMIERYMNATGDLKDWDYHVAVGTDGKRSFKYYEEETDENGKTKKVEKTMSFEEMAEKIATAEALKAQQSEAIKVNEMLDKIQVNQGVGVANALASWTTSGELSENLSLNDFEKLKNSIGDDPTSYLETTYGKDIDEIAKELGFKTTNALLNSFNTAITDKEKEFKDVARMVPEAVQGQFQDFIDKNDAFGKLDAQSQTKIANSLSEAYISGGQTGYEMMEKILGDATDSQEITKLSDALSGLDWTKATPTDITKKLEELGIETSLTTTELESLINLMSDGVVKMSSFGETYKSLTSAVQDLNISQEEWIKMSELGLGHYFTQMYDGTYQLIGAAEDFEQVLRELMQESYKSTLDTARNRLTEIGQEQTNVKQRLKDAGFDEYYTDSTLDGISTNPLINKDLGPVAIGEDGKATYNIHHDATYKQETKRHGFLWLNATTTTVEDKAAWDETKELSDTTVDAYNKRIDYIEAMGVAGKDLIETWRNSSDMAATEAEILGTYLPMAIEKHKKLESLDEIQKAAILQAEEALLSTAENSEERKQLYESEGMNSQSYAKAVNAAIEQESWEGLNQEEVAEYAQYLEDSLNVAEEGAEEVARAVAKMNKGVETLSSNWEDWSSILKKSGKTSQEYAKAMQGTRNALSDILDVSEEFIDVSFVESAENLELIGKAAQGDAEAIDKLGEALAEDIALDAVTKQLDLGSVISIDGIDYVGDAAREKISSLMSEISGLLDGSNLSLGENLNTGDLFAKLNEVVIASKMTAEEANAFYRSMGFTPHFKMVDAVQAESVPLTKTYHKSSPVETGPDGEKSWVETEYSETVQVPGGELHSALPSMAMESGDGKMPQVPSTEIESVTYTGGGSLNNLSSTNSGGKGGGETPKKTSDSRKKKSDVVDRYKEINDELEENNRLMEKNTTAAEGLWGSARIAKLKENVSLMKKENELLGKKAELAKQYLAEDKADLQKAAAEAGVTFTFNSDQNIDNYTDQMTALYNRRESLLNSFGDTIEDDEQELLDDLDNKIDNLKTAYETYEGTLDEVKDLQQEQIEKDLAIQQENFAVLQKELEIKLSINEDDLATIEYYLSKMSDDFYSMAEVAALMIGDVSKGDSTFGNTKDGRQSQGMNYLEDLELYKEQEENLHKEYAANNITKEDYIEGLRNVKQGYIDNLQALQELDKTMMSYYADTLAAGQEELSKYTAQMDRHNAVLEHYSSILDIIGKSKDFESMGVVLEAQAHTAENAVKVAEENYNMLRKQADQRKAEYEAELAAKGEDDPGVQMLKKQWLDAEEVVGEAQDDMMQKTEEWAQALKAVVENELEGLARELEKAFTANFGNSFEAMNTQMERAKSLQEEYLTTTNQVYETNKLIRQSQQEIDKTTNSVAKRRLKDFINETEQLQNKNKLSKFELEIQQAKYDLLLAEIALEEAQNAKSTVRLQRDSEGNFGYVYTADQNAIAEAEQKFADAQNSLYNIGLEGANDYTEKYQQTLQEFYDTMTELQTQYLNGEFETEAEYQAAMMEAQEFYYAKLQEYSELYGIAVAVDANIVRDAWSTEFQSMTQSSAQWQSAITTYLAGVEQAFGKWETYVDQIRNKTIGPDLEALKDKTNDIKDANDAITTSITKDNGLLAALDSEYTKVAALTLEYSKMKTAIDGVISSYQQYIDDIDAAIQKESGYEDGTGTGTGTGDGSDTSGTNTGSNSGSGSEDSSGSGGNISSQFGSATWERGKAAYDKINAGVWGNGAARVSNGLAAGFTQDEINLGQYMINLVYPTYIKGQGKTWEEAKKLLGFDTGGYTGDWGGSYGKLAMLHKKELVLNAGDTDNFLAGMEMLDNIVKTIDLYSMNAQLGGILSSPSFGFNNRIEPIEQNVHIEAHFPEATDRNEITEAINTLVNQASQFVNRK